MDRELFWAPWDGPGLEHLRLAVNAEGAIADGLVIGMAEERSFRVRYEVRCDARWRVREVRLTVPGSDVPDIRLIADGDGRWSTHGGAAVPALDGCIDVDISATPFTNTLPIRRLRLRPGESAELTVAWVSVPELHLTAERQRYECVAARPDGGLYRFEVPPDESLPSGFTAYLPVDTDGLVVDYPGLFRRVWPT